MYYFYLYKFFVMTFFKMLIQTTRSYISNLFGKIVAYQSGSALIYDMGDTLTLMYHNNTFQYRNKDGDLHRNSGPAFITNCTLWSHREDVHNKLGTSKDCGTGMSINKYYYYKGEFVGTCKEDLKYYLENK